MAAMVNVEYIDIQNINAVPPQELLDSSAVDAIQNKFDEFLEQDPILSSVIMKLQEASIPAVIFGGWVRDHYISFKKGINLQPRDIDIVVDLPQGASLESIVKNDHTKTMFGGLATKTTTSSLDIWDISDTYLIKSLTLNPNIGVLPSTTVFSINSIIFYPSQLHPKSMVFESGFLDAIETGIISFKSSRIPFPAIQAARAIMYSTKCSFEIHEDVKNFIIDVCDSPYSIKNVIDGIKNYCPQAIKGKAISVFIQILEEAGIDYLPKTLFFNHCWGVFEGGGVRAAALAGAYEAAVSSGVNFGRVAGTSAGSIVAALISSGAKPEYILSELEGKDFQDFMRPVLSKDNAFGSNSFLNIFTKPFRGRFGTLFNVWQNSGSYSSIEVQKWLDNILCRLLGVSSPAKFGDLKLPLYVVATDVVGGKPKLWSKEETPNESVAFAVRCSCSIPFYFQPVSDGTSLLVDGGIISNLPAWVFSTPEMQEKLSRIICFRLHDNILSEMNNLTDFFEGLISSIVSGGTDIQLQLQNNVYTVNIPTGEFRATDFDTVDNQAKEWLRKSGFDSVSRFISGERITVRNRPENIVYSGYDKKLLLLVQYLSEAINDILIVSSNSYWLYFIFPAIAFSLKRGVSVNVMLKPANHDSFERHEAHRQKLLENIGVGMCIRDVLPFDGFILDRSSDGAIAAISTAEGIVGMDYEYSEEKIRVYSKKAYDLPIMCALNNQIDLLLSKKRKKIDLVLEPINPGVVFEKLKKIPQYRRAMFTLESVKLDDNLLTLDLHVKEYKLAQVTQLAEVFRNSNIELFSPASFRTGSEVNSIVTPPILEKVGQELVIIEGHTRFYYSLKNNIESIKAIVITGVKSSLPAKPRPISMLNLASDTLDRADLFVELDKSQIREIEQVLHPLED